MKKDLETLVFEYCENLKEIQSRRFLWEQEKRDFILKELSELNNTYNELKWDVINGSGNNIKNLEYVSWSMNSTQFVFNNGLSKYVPFSGCLKYAQLINGKIIVEIEYPYFSTSLGSEISRKIPSKIIGEFSPNEINKKIILKHAEEFIIEITDWTINVDK